MHPGIMAKNTNKKITIGNVYRSPRKNNSNPKIENCRQADKPNNV